MSKMSEKVIQLYVGAMKAPHEHQGTPARSWIALDQKLRSLWKRGRYSVVFDVLSATVGDDEVRVRERVFASYLFASFASRAADSDHRSLYARWEKDVRDALDWALAQRPEPWLRILLLSGYARFEWGTSRETAARRAEEAVRMLRERLASARRRQNRHLQAEYADLGFVCGPIHILKQTSTAPRLLASISRELELARSGRTDTE